MANIKITDLNNFADPNSTDVLPIVDVAEDETKRVSIGNLMKSAFAGTAALPGVAFAVDEDTGMYRNASDQLAFATGGTERILIDDNGDVTISGSLTVNGTTTTIDSTTLTVEDKNIELGVVDTPSDTTADGGGITLKGATDKTLNWVNSSDSWTSSENVDLASGKTYKIAGTDVLSNNTLGSGVTGSSLTSVGTITTGVWNATALTADAIGADAINGSKIADDSIDSEHYVDGSIDNAHLSADCVNGSKIADDSIDSEHYVDGSIDNAHVSASAAIAGTKISPDFGAQDLTVDTNVLHVDATNDRVGVGTASVDTKLVVAGNNNGSTNNNTLRFVDLDTSSSATQESGRIEFFTSDSTQSGIHSYIAGQTLDTNGNGGLTFGTGLAGSATEKVRIDDSGRLLVGTDTDIADTGTALLQAAWTGGGGLILARNDTSVTEGNDLGYIKFMGNDTTSNTYRNLGLIQVEADGTHAAGDNPTRMLFWTTADGAEDPTERMRISANGQVRIQAEGTELLRITQAVDAATQQEYGIGFASNPDHTNPGAQITFEEFDASDSRGGLLFYTRNSNDDSAPTERMRISADGEVRIIGTMEADANNAYNLVIRGDDSGTNGESAQIFLGAINSSTRGAVIAAELQSTSNNHDMLFKVSAASAAPTERMRLDSSGRLLIGNSSSIRGGALEVLAETADTQIQVTESSDSGDGPQLRLTRTRGSDLGSPEPVQNGNNLGRVRWTSWDSAAYRIGAEISAHADGQTWASGDCPSRLIFSVTADGGSAPTERVRISQDGLTRFTHSATDTPKTVLHVDGSGITTGGGSAIFLKSSSNTTEDRFGTRIHTIRESFNNGASSLVISNENAAASALDEAVRINSGGQVLIGSGTASSTTAAARLQVIDGVGGQLCIARNDDTISTGNNIGQIRFRSADGGYQDCARIICDSEGTHGADDKPSNLQFHVTPDGSGNTTARMRIGRAGQLDTFATSANALDVHTAYTGSTDIVFAVKTGATGLDDGTVVMQVFADGDVENTNNRYTGISDIKFKENIVDANSQWGDLKAIRVVNFNYKEEKNWGTHRQIGVIAQEIEQVSPGLIVQRQEEDEGEEYKSVAYSVLYMKAVKALQEAMERIETLEAKVAALEAN